MKQCQQQLAGARHSNFLAIFFFKIKSSFILFFFLFLTRSLTLCKTRASLSKCCFVAAQCNNKKSRHTLCVNGINVINGVNMQEISKCPTAAKAPVTKLLFRLQAFFLGGEAHFITRLQFLYPHFLSQQPFKPEVSGDKRRFKDNVVALSLTWT